MYVNTTDTFPTLPGEIGVDTPTNGTSSLTVSPAYSISLFLFGVFGNVLALVLLARSPKQQRQSAFYSLVAALAVTDLVGTMTTSQVPILVYSHTLVLKGDTVLCDFVGFIMIFFGVATIHVLLFMTFERYLAFRHPYKYSRWINKKRAKISCIVSWIAAVIFSMFPLVGFGSYSIHFPNTWCFFNYYGKTPAEAAFVYFYVLYGLLTFFAIVVSNAIVVYELVKMRRKTKQQSATNQDSKDLDMIRVMIGVVVVQGACWLPLLINVLVDQITLHPYYIADVMTIRIASLNQIIDPWIYIILRRDFFRRIKTIITQLTPSFKLPGQLRFKTEKTTENGGKDMIRLCSVEKSEVDDSHATAGNDVEGHVDTHTPKQSPVKKSEMKTSLLLDDAVDTVDV